MRIALLGDIALFGHCTSSDYFKEIAEYLAGFDYVIGNLETPFSAAKKTHGAKSAYICADSQSVSILKQLHINAVTLANNHMFDYGKEGYELTKKLLDNNGIEWFGSEGKELQLELYGNKIAFAGYCCYTTNPLCCVKYGDYGVNAYNFVNAKEFITKKTSDGFLPVIAVHAGLEHVNYPSLEHVRAARQLASAGSYIYYGHHPHVIQGVEEYHGSLIAHSLGNFCFDDVYTDNSSTPLVELTDNNRTGMILELTVKNNKIESWREQLLLISGEGGIGLMNNNDTIIEYNACLVDCENQVSKYTEKRNQIISKRISERKTKRNIIWYLKRLRLRYVQILVNAKLNSKNFNSCVKQYISK